MQGLFTELMLDVRFGARVLRRSPGFTALAAGILALGIGAASAIFSLVDAALLRPLPFHEPDQLVMLNERMPGYAFNRVAPLNFLDWREQNQSLSAIAAIAGGSLTLTTNGSAAEKIPRQAVSASFFDVLGITPVAGRFFAAEEEKPGSSVVVLSERLWKSRFGADPKLVGAVVRLDGVPFTVIGIAPASFEILFRSDLWTPYAMRRGPEQRKMHYLSVIARLRPGVTADQARADLEQVAANISRIAPDTNKDVGITIRPLREGLIGKQLRTTSWVLAGVVGFVLLIACANVANLLLARGTARSREIVVRASLGGSRTRILRQLLTETLLLAAIGGAAGVGLAKAIVSLSASFLPPDTLPPGLHLAIDSRILGFSVTLTAVTGILFGLAPAWIATQLTLADALRSGGRNATGGGGRLRAGLAIAEIAIAVLLVAGSGLLIRTIASLQQVDPGFRAENVLTMSIGLPFGRYAASRLPAFYEEVEREVNAISGVKSASIGGNVPLDGWDIGQGFQIVGDPEVDGSKRPAAHYQMVGTRYFETLGIPLVSGRAFEDQDSATAPQVCIVNEEFVRRYLKDRNPIGALVKVDSMDVRGPTPVVRQVVGVSRQVKVEGLGEERAAVEVYVPVRQNSWYSASLSVKSQGGDPTVLIGSVRAAMAKVDKDVPLTRIRTMDEVTAEAMTEPRFRAVLLTCFAAIAVALAAVGVFGVLAFSVGQRTREFGIRMALGAKSGDVVRMVTGGALRITGIGVVLGSVAAALLTRSLASFLFGVKPIDPMTFLMTPLILTGVALVAAAVPAIRASRVDPAVALRDE